MAVLGEMAVLGRSRAAILGLVGRQARRLAIGSAEGWVGRDRAAATTAGVGWGAFG